MRNQYDPKKHHRRSIRLKGYDYSQEGLYFITKCVKNKACLFGHITDGEMILNDAGKMVEKEWLKIPDRFPNTELHEYVVMPNHFHAIIEITNILPNPVGAIPCGCPNCGKQICDCPKINGCPKCGKQICSCTNPMTNNRQPSNQGQPQGIAPTSETADTIPKRLGDMVGAFHSIVSVEYIRGVKTLDWQPFNGKLLQRNYWEHIIRDLKSYNNISNYIIENPKNWKDDKFFNL